MEWQARFLDDCKRKGLTPRSIEWYGRLFHIVKSGYGFDFDSATEDDLRRVSNLLTSKSRSYQIIVLGFIKRCLLYIEKGELAKKVIIPKPEDRVGKVKEKLLTQEQIKKLIQKAPTVQDRLLIEILCESGARSGEIYNLKIKDVGFDEHSAILWLKGKSGTRRRRIYFCIPDLRSHLNNHPAKDNPDARLFHLGRRDSSDFNAKTIYRHITRLGREILGKSIYPHQFRHTKATEDSRLFTDRELMLLFGWTQPSMISIYSHLSQRDVDDKDLILHGKKRKEEILRPIVSVQKCESCGSENAPVAVYCHKCGKILASVADEKAQQTIKELQDRLGKVEEIFEARQLLMQPDFELDVETMIAVKKASKKLNLKGQAEYDLIRLVSNPALEKRDKKKLLDTLIGEAESSKTVA